jgi:hypothetical protein
MTVLYTLTVRVSPPLGRFSWGVGQVERNLPFRVIFLARFPVMLF